MNQVIKKLWVAALRSGRFYQGTGQLKRGRIDPVHCCLGVLSEIAKDEGVIKSFKGTNGYLNKKVAQWAELRDIDPILGSDRASHLNDKGENFDSIATLIDRYL